MKIIKPYYLPTILLLGLMACSDTADPATDEGLLNVVWNIDSLQTPDTTIVAPTSGYATIQFTEEMAVRGHSTVLLSYHGIYGIAENRLLSIDIVEPAELQCSRPSMQCIFINALEKVTTHEVNESRLRLYQDNRYVLYFHSSLFEEELVYTTWKVDSLKTPDVKILRGPDTLITIIQSNDTTHVPRLSETFMTMQFKEDMRISGILFCNSYLGTYVITDQRNLTLDVLSWTEMACVKWPESFFINALENVTAYEAASGRLTLYDEDRSYVVNLSPE